MILHFEYSNFVTRIEISDLKKLGISIFIKAQQFSGFLSAILDSQFWIWKCWYHIRIQRPQKPSGSNFYENRNNITLFFLKIVKESKYFQKGKNRSGNFFFYCEENRSYPLVETTYYKFLFLHYNVTFRPKKLQE